MPKHCTNVECTQFWEGHSKHANFKNVINLNITMQLLIEHETKSAVENAVNAEVGEPASSYLSFFFSLVNIRLLTHRVSVLLRDVGVQYCCSVANSCLCMRDVITRVRLRNWSDVIAGVDCVECLVLFVVLQRWTGRLLGRLERR